jgi:hypothetical protein
VAKITTRHPGINNFTHNFAKQYGFKTKNDTIGHWMKHVIAKQELDKDCHASSALACFYLANDYIKKNKSSSEGMIHDKSPKLQHKSPHSATKRFIVYVEDNIDKYNDLVQDHSDEPDFHFVFTNREFMQATEDTLAVKDTSKFYQFHHSNNRDNYSIDDFPLCGMTDDGLYVCRVCKKTYKAQIPFEMHQDICAYAIQLKKAHCIEYRKAPCYCIDCVNGGRICSFKHITGHFKPLWMVSINDQKEVQTLVQNHRTQRKNQIISQNARSAIAVILQKHGSLHGNMSDVTIEQKELRVEQYHALTFVLGIQVERLDGKNSNPRRQDYIHALETSVGGWDQIIILMDGL